MIKKVGWGKRERGGRRGGGRGRRRIQGEEFRMWGGGRGVGRVGKQ